MKRWVRFSSRLSIPANLAMVTFVLVAVTCTMKAHTPNIAGLDLHMTLFHTSDMHSRILPYYISFAGNAPDDNLGLQNCAEDKTGVQASTRIDRCVGGFPRLSTILQRERLRADRFLWVDTGDFTQGAPIYSVWNEVDVYLNESTGAVYDEDRSGAHRVLPGEAELRALSKMGLDVAVIGNHEFDSGAENIANVLERWAGFPLLAANYRFEDPDDPVNVKLGRLIRPYVILNQRGLRIAVLGLGDVETIVSIQEGGNSLGITPLDTYQTAQEYIDILINEADLIVVLTHQGFSSDQDLIRNVSGMDAVFGGHLHVAFEEPKVLIDPAGREVPLVHSGAFTKFAGRLDVTLRETERDFGPEDRAYRGKWEIVAHEHETIPLNARDIPDNEGDPEILEILEPYVLAMNQRFNLERIVAWSRMTVDRYADGGGDSGLGNIVAESMQYRDWVETDFSLTNSTGIRTDIDPGPLTLEALYNVFPFDNTIATMFLSGWEVQELFDYVARRTASRSCGTQAQISGATIVINCSHRKSYNITIGGSGAPCTDDDDCPEGEGEICTATGRCGSPLDCNATYELATNDYIARGGSGYEMLERNMTQTNTGITMRSSVMDYLEDIEYAPLCSELVDAIDPDMCAFVSDDSALPPDDANWREYCELPERWGDPSIHDWIHCIPDPSADPDLGYSLGIEDHRSTTETRRLREPEDEEEIKVYCGDFFEEY